MRISEFLNKKINRGVIIAVLISLVLASLYFNFSKRLESHEFLGSLNKVEGTHLYSNGVFIVTPDQPKYHNPEYYKDVIIDVTPTTTFVKEVYTMPTSEELKKTGGRYSWADLKHEAAAGTINDLTNSGGRPIKVTTQKNIYGKDRFQADEVEYIEQYFPDLNYPQ